jgi:hypothetical protein
VKTSNLTYFQEVLKLERRDFQGVVSLPLADLLRALSRGIVLGFIEKDFKCIASHSLEDSNFS